MKILWTYHFSSKNLPKSNYSQSRETVDLEEKPGSKARSGAKEPKG